VELVIWVVTEDSNSARDFWTKVFDTFVGNDNLTPDDNIFE
jgi:hypothetical protein